MPANPQTCRWCRATRVRTGLPECPLLCPGGCADTHATPYSAFCEDCAREFTTGSSYTRQCYSCAKAEEAPYVAEYAEPTLAHTGYGHDMRKKGANRRALALKQERGAA